MKLKLYQVQTFETTMKAMKNKQQQRKNTGDQQKAWIQRKSMNTTDDQWKARIGRYSNAACNP